jgi:hypothetical protein
MSGDLEKFENYEIMEGFYVVEQILEKKRQKGEWKYKVKWEGYSMDECTWEPKENLNACKELLCEFEKNWCIKNRPKKEALEEIKLVSPVEKIKSMQDESPFGDIDKDKGEKIIEAKIIDDINVELNCLVKWKTRQDLTPQSTWISSNIIRKKDPELLLRYYESKILFPKI